MKSPPGLSEETTFLKFLFIDFGERRGVWRNINVFHLYTLSLFDSCLRPDRGGRRERALSPGVPRCRLAELPAGRDPWVSAFAQTSYAGRFPPFRRHALARWLGGWLRGVHTGSQFFAEAPWTEIVSQAHGEGPGEAWREMCENMGGRHAWGGKVTGFLSGDSDAPGSPVW